MLQEDQAGLPDEDLNDVDAWLSGINRGRQEPVQEVEEQAPNEHKEQPRA